MFRALSTLLVASTLIAMPSAGRAGEPDALHYDPAVDLPVTFAAGGLFVGLFLGAKRQPLSNAVPAEPPGAIDGLGVRSLQESYVLPSDIVLYGSLAAGLGLAAYDGASDDALLSRIGLYAEAFVICGAVTELTKWAVRRPRPYTYDERLGKPDDDLSFFSGHTSQTAAAAFFTARAIDLTGDLSQGERIAIYSTAGALTVGVGTLRVAAGKHWPSDVLVGAFVGSSVGWLVAELHRSDSVSVSAAPLPEGGATVALSGRW